MTNDVTSPHPHLRLDRQEAVLRVTLCRPERRNAQTPSLWLALADIAENLPQDVRVVVLAGEGPAFSAGLDRGMLAPGGIEGEPDLLGLAAAGKREALADQIATFQRGFTAWRDCHALVVAAVQGHAVGAGFQLALAADLRLMADDAQFVMGEVGLGLVPDLGGTAPLARLVGQSRALEICLTGRPIGAHEATALGLVSLAVPAAELGSTVDDLISAVLQAPEPTMRAMIHLFRGVFERSPQEQLRLERESQSGLLIGLARPAENRTG